VADGGLVVMITVTKSCDPVNEVFLAKERG